MKSQVYKLDLTPEQTVFLVLLLQEVISRVSEEGNFTVTGLDMTEKSLNCILDIISSLAPITRHALSILEGQLKTDGRNN